MESLTNRIDHIKNRKSGMVDEAEELEHLVNFKGKFENKHMNKTWKCNNNHKSTYPWLMVKNTIGKAHRISSGKRKRKISKLIEKSAQPKRPTE